jgi:hypothetical protein
MNIITGIIRPERNWAPKEDVVQRVVVAGEGGLDLLGAPEHLHQRVAGVGLLDLGVHVAGRLPHVREPTLGSAPMSTAAASETGTAMRAMIASTGDTQNIMNRTPTRVSRFDSSWLRVCCSDWAMLSMSLVTRLRQLAAGLPVEERQRKASELGLDLLAQPVDRVLHGGVQHPAGAPGQQAADEGQAEGEQPTRPRRPSRRPAPGVTFMPDSRSAKVPCPLARTVR